MTGGAAGLARLVAEVLTDANFREEGTSARVPHWGYEGLFAVTPTAGEGAEYAVVTAAPADMQAEDRELLLDRFHGVLSHERPLTVTRRSGSLLVRWYKDTASSLMLAYD